MGLNRRNVLVGLGGLAAGGGALASTGAFTTVSAERTVSVSTAGDGSAFLGITGTTQGLNYIDGATSGGTVTIDLGEDTTSGSGFNQNAITRIGSLLQLTNNSAEDEQITVGVSSDSPSASQSANQSAQLALPSNGTEEAVVTFVVLDSDSNVSDYGLDDSDGTVSSSPTVDKTVSSGQTKELGVIIDTRDDVLGSSTASQDNTLSIVANGT
jgi:hypothetical protein